MTFISLKKKLISGFILIFFFFAPFPVALILIWGYHIYPEKEKKKKRRKENRQKVHGNGGPISDHGPFFMGSNHHVPWMRSLYLIKHSMLIGQFHCFNVYDGVSGDNF